MLDFENYDLWMPLIETVIKTVFEKLFDLVLSKKQKPIIQLTTGNSSKKVANRSKKKTATLRK
jgi:hypothetical protein